MAFGERQINISLGGDYSRALAIADSAYGAMVFTLTCALI